MNYPPKTLLEQQCMTFCAVMKAMEGHLTEHNILATCDKVWRWTRETLNAASNGIPETATEEETPETTVTEEFVRRPTVQSISEKQRKFLYAVGYENGYDYDALHVFLKTKFGFESTYDIPRNQFTAILRAVETKGDEWSVNGRQTAHDVASRSRWTRSYFLPQACLERRRKFAGYVPIWAVLSASAGIRKSSSIQPAIPANRR